MSRLSMVLTFVCAIVVSGCASERDPAAPASQGPSQHLASSSDLAQDTELRDGWTYRAPNRDAAKYRRFMIEPVVVYAGPEASFGQMSEENRRRMAVLVDEEFMKTVGERFPLASSSGPDVLRIRLTLLGVEETVGALALTSRILPIGIAVNAIKGAAGESGSFTGSIELAFEAFDSQTGELLAAAIRRAAPAIYDVGAAASTANTVRSSARVLAKQLNEGIELAQQR